MTDDANFLLVRRRACQLLGMAAVGAVTAPEAWAAPVSIRIVADKGVENHTMIGLMNSQGYLAACGVRQNLVMVDKPAATLHALLDDQADLCVTSAFNGLLPAIAKGAPVKIVGAAMQKLALAVYSGRLNITSVADLAGCTLGIGPEFGLLHVAALALMRAKGIDPAKVQFVNLDSNLDVYRHVKAGTLDAGISDVADMAGTKSSGPHILSDGRLWQTLPDYPYQLAYVSARAISDNRDGIVRALAAYGRLFRFVSSPGSGSAYAAARAAVGGNRQSAAAMWHFIQTTQPYTGSPGIPTKRIFYLQGLDVSVGLQPAVLPLDAVADLSLAHDAMAMI